MSIGDIFCLFFIFTALQPMLRQRVLEAVRTPAERRWWRGISPNTAAKGGRRPGSVRVVKFNSEAGMP
jgi:hypothetical protein